MIQFTNFASSNISINLFPSFGSKSALEELLERRCHAPADASAAIAEDATNSEVSRRVQHFNDATTSAQEYMPPSVRLEIRGLIEQEYVSGALNSAHAGEIERSLREGLEDSKETSRRADAEAFLHLAEQKIERCKICKTVIDIHLALV